MTATSIFLIVKLVIVKRRFRRILESVRVRDVYTNDAIDNAVSILKELLDLVATNSMSANPFVHTLSRKLLIHPSDPSSIFHDFDKIADVRFYGVLTDLKKNYTDLTADDLLFCSFICFDFNSSAVGMIYGHTNSQSLYNRRFRLRKRMGMNNESDHIKTYLKERIQILSNS